MLNFGVVKRLAAAKKQFLRERAEDEGRERLTDLGVLLGKRANRFTELGARLLTDYDPVADIMVLMGREVKRWGPMDRALREAGDPLALSGGFAGLSYKPLSDALGAVTFVAGDFAPFTATTYTPVFSSTDPERSPVHFSLYWGHTLALAASPGTLLITPGVGTAVSAKNLGAGVASGTLGTSGTAGGFLRHELSIYGTGSGTDARCWSSGHWVGKYATSGNGTVDLNQILGYTALTFDSTAANGLWTTATGTATTVSMTTRTIRWASWN